REAHEVGARVYVALNTILTDEQLPEAVSLAWDLYGAGADALIIQDMGLLMEKLPPIPLHASTQCHNDSNAKLRTLEALGMEQVVLPREVSTADLPSLLDGVGMRVESFVHGALCVSYSGRCFISEACRGRSANRGACAQYCRMSYDLEDAMGRKLLTGQHLLSLRDLNRTEIIEEMLDRGVSSLKIEGRLKDIDYVRNVTAHYRRVVDEIISRRSEEYCRSSWGETELTFAPRPEQTFSRRFTAYNTPLHTPIPTESITPYTNKSVGEELGTLTECRGREMVLQLRDMGAELSNGDGLLLVSPDETTTAGALVNQVTPFGDGTYRLRLSGSVEMPPGAMVFRNLNHRLDRLLRRDDASSRKVQISMECEATEQGIILRAAVAEAPSIAVEVQRDMALEPAEKDPTARLIDTLSKLGDTPYRVEQPELRLRGLYLPPSVVTELRRELVERLREACRRAMTEERDHRGERLREQRRDFLSRDHSREESGLPASLDFTYNVANRQAEWLYRRLGVEGEIAPAMEVAMPEGSVPVMQTRHCLLHRLGYCTREGKRPPFALPLYLVRGQERFRITTDCRACQMTLWLDR
uniref:peptidase U32 family protein n=1 Tax=uncultured Porphyromonas sp. TaxID=159274 RepID=UPI0025E00943